MTKQESRSGEIDTDKCVELAGANRYNLVLMASVRSREISRRNKESTRFEHLHPNVTAILEIQDGKIGTEYLKKVN
jgi:DNA-directed RNA polymerase subunit K/omega